MLWPRRFLFGFVVLSTSIFVGCGARSMVDDMVRGTVGSIDGGLPGYDAGTLDAGACGDGLCDNGETPYTCLRDCGYCGDGICAPNESFATCPQDCQRTITPVCGNHVCEPGETPSNILQLPPGLSRLLRRWHLPAGAWRDAEQLPRLLQPVLRRWDLR
jgi:hypothetical protein